MTDEAWTTAMGLARRQGGVVSYRQLRDVGVGRYAIDAARRRALLTPASHGILKVGPGLLGWRGRAHVALLVGGRDAVLSHRSAAVLWGLLEEDRGPMHVTTTRDVGDRDDVRCHRAALRAAEQRRRDGFPCTDLVRTLLDCAATESDGLLEHLVEQAFVRHGRVVRALAEDPAALPRRRGAGRLRRAVARVAAVPGRGAVRSPLERRFWRLLRTGGSRIPPHDCNATIRLGRDTFVVDVLFRRERVIVELDSRAWHENDPRFDADRRRDRRLAAEGWLVVRVTARDLRDHPQEVLADLLRVLAGR